MLGIERGSSRSYYIVLALEEATHLLVRQTTECCEGHSGMIWTHLVCSSCITFRLNIEVLAQHIPRFSYTSPTSSELTDGFTETFFTGCCNTARG
jgi:hypothetical protein